MQGQLELIPNDKVQKNLSKENLKMPAIMNDIPFDKIYQAAKKKKKKKKPVFHIHKYFARRITSNFRMMLLGLLLPYDESVLDEAIVFMNTSKQAARIKCATIGWTALDNMVCNCEKCQKK